MDASENVFAFPNSAERKAATAMSAYAAGLADITNGRIKTIRAVIDYGRALQEGRNGRSNIAFSEWVHANKLDQGDPWSDQRERHAARQIAGIVHGNAPVDGDAFADCPNTRPVDIMKWWRTKHPETVKDRKPRAESTEKAFDAIQTMEAAGEKVTEKTVAKRAGIHHRTADKAIAVHAAKRAAAEQAIAETTAKLTDEQELANAKFSAKSKLTIDKAIALHKKRLEQKFWTVVGEEVRKGIKEADDATRKQNAEMRQRIMGLERMLRGGVLFTLDEYTTVLACLHPDNSASEAKRARAFDLFRQKKPRLIGP